MKLARLIELAHRQGHRQWAKAGGHLGMTHSEYEYLRAIQDQEARKTDKDNHGQHLQDVVDEMGVRKASASAMVLKLEERGLVVRFPCQYDARAQHIMLTEQGQTLLSSGEEIYEAAAQALLAGLSEYDIEALKIAIDQLGKSG
ncbi:MarR family winged helix-turn-helix transcriptional regulator [Phaeobacter piscinae]|uniref:MarR family winged helix-turn-helix transcriptional regulator n=1 Tax=Phaeobacter piscinae TaxID=1580596 RepID=UPI0006941930|nr:MarR family winged helix-turn-helix transcriptional regulator [Phaeobacter piscinae]UTS80891.1 Transcriptional regulator SlyA [Phaeobacter piscinae]